MQTATMEQERVLALQRTGLLDTEPEQEFDDLSALAAAVCAAPIGNITLIDEDRQYIKSSHGGATGNTTLEQSICATAIRQNSDEAFVVEDLSADARFSALDAVRSEAHIRFYAGWPLTTHAGHVLGMLCVADTMPRSISSQQKMALQVLARQVVTEIELRMKARELENALEELETANERLENLSHRDPLTGILNRRALDQSLDREVKYSERYHSPLSALMLDIDHFKSVNDTYGHSTGDRILCAVASVLSQIARKTDIVARYGGEEFCVLLPNTPIENTRIFAERIRASVEQAEIDGIKVTISIGCSALSETSHALLDIADKALYQAKSDGRNCVR